MINLENKLIEIYNLVDDNYGEDACIEFFNLIQDLELNNDHNLPELYYKFAMMLFDNGFIEDSIKNFSKAYKLNSHKDEIKEFIFNHFIDFNLTNFKFAYDINSDLYCSNGLLDYDCLNTEFIPITSDKYYVFDLINDNFDEVIDFSDLRSNNSLKLWDEFNSIIIIDDKNLKYTDIYFNNIDNRKIFFISPDKNKLFSLFKLPNIDPSFIKNLNYFSSIDELKDYLKNNLDEYLPKNFIISNNSTEIKNDLISFIDKQHNFRISPSGRSENNILLTICLLENDFNDLNIFKSLNQLVQLKYNSEIEFLIINNSIEKNIETKNKIISFNDSRISYYETQNHLEFSYSFAKGLELSKGAFTLFLQSGDFINTCLDNYLNILKNNPNIGIMRSGTSSSYSNMTQSLSTAGEHNYLSFFLSNNVWKGIIYNSSYIRNSNLIKELYNALNNDNSFAKVYPQMYLDAFLSLKKDVYHNPNIIYIENPNISNSSSKTISEDLENHLGYSSYKQRIKQHYSAISLINNLNLSEDTLLSSYENLCWKTIFLSSLVYKNYQEANYNLDKIQEELYDCCINGIDMLNINISESKHLDLEYSIQSFLNEFKKYIN